MEWLILKKELEELLNDCEIELIDIKARIKQTSPLDKMRVYLTQYALIRASGTAEYVFKSIVADYFDRFKDSKIDTYIEKTVRIGSMSVKYDNMSKLLGKFDEQWKKDFQNRTKKRNDFERLKLSSDSLVENRHAFAHGKHPTATFKDILGYYYDVVELLRILDDVVQ